MLCPFVCVFVSVPTFFSTRPSNCKQIWHACADRSGNHSSPNKFDPPNPKGVSGGFYGVNNSKVQEMSWAAQKINKKINPHPTGGGGWVEVLGIKISKVGEISWTVEKIDSFCYPSPPPTRGSFMGHNFSIKFWKVYQECNYPERLHCQYPGWSQVIRGRDPGGMEGGNPSEAR